MERTDGENNEPRLRSERGMLSKMSAAASLLMFNIPQNPAKVPFITSNPDGMMLLYTASTVPEAEMLRQMLADAGFHPEFVPSIMMGVFGIGGNPQIYVPADEIKDATE